MLAYAYNIAAAVLVACYLLVRLWKYRSSQLWEWGFTTEHFTESLRTQAPSILLGCIALYLLGMFLGHTPLPSSFFLTIALYPIWGIAQQFALQNLLARNLTGILPHPLTRAIVASACFSLAHTPEFMLMALTFIVGIFFTLIYFKYRNLWAIGITHGIIGSLVFYLVVGEDPLAIVQTYFL